MIDESTMYWITRLDSIHVVFNVFLVLFSISFVSMGIPIILEIFGVECFREDSSPRLFRYLWLGALFGLFLSLAGYVLVPTTKEMVVIKVVPAIANNRDVKALGEEFPRMAKEWLESQFKDKDNNKK
jgi:hypothetical protein